MRRQKPTPDQEAVARLRLARTEGVGPITYRRLLRRYLSAEAALDAVPRLARAGGRATAPAIPDPGEVRRELDALGKLGARMLFLDTPGYPELLALLDDAPPALAVIGDSDTLGPPAIAMVGGRNASANGQRIAESLAEALAQTLVVVSGLARGIDAAAHRGALLSGRTVAAVAGGWTCPTRRKTPTCSAASPKPGRWSARRRSAPPRRRATSPAATGSSPACRSAWWWWRRRHARAA